MKIWLHRISHHAETSYPLLDRGYLSIGFSDFADASFIERIINGEREFFEQEFQRRWGRRPKTRISLWNFITQIESGDRIVVPSSGTFSIYDVVDHRAYCVGEIDITGLKTVNGDKVVKDENGLLRNEKTQQLIDLGFVRKVVPLVIAIPRSEYADAALASRMKIRSTTVNISDLTHSVEQAIKAHQESQPINLHSKLLSEQIRSTLALIKSQLTPDKFEHLIKWYFRKVGATEVDIPAKNERDKAGDADVIAVFEPIKTIIYVQAKKHNGETSDWAASQIQEYKDHKNTSDGYSRIAWVVSTCDKFSPNCIKLAEANNVVLFDGKAFVTLLLEAGIGGLEALG
jgi:restriction endonuclease Mrr